MLKTIVYLITLFGVFFSDGCKCLVFGSWFRFSWRQCFRDFDRNDAIMWVAHNSTVFQCCSIFIYSTSLLVFFFKHFGIIFDGLPCDFFLHIYLSILMSSTGPNLSKTLRALFWQVIVRKSWSIDRKIVHYQRYPGKGIRNNPNRTDNISSDT